ncbi:MAG: hypothetical protein KIS73_19915 [Enhydrobacter sp.]|nr:hypothetical protein [Enhydrobacter sp.]
MAQGAGVTARKPARAWTARDTAAMRELVALNWTDGEIARALGVVRLTVWRRRTALGLDRADHPRKENRVRTGAVATPGTTKTMER